MRVPAKPLHSYPFYLQPFFWNQRRKYGEVLQAALLWARAPKLFAAVAMLYGMPLRDVGERIAFGHNQSSLTAAKILSDLLADQNSAAGCDSTAQLDWQAGERKRPGRDQRPFL